MHGNENPLGNTLRTWIIIIYIYKLAIRTKMSHSMLASTIKMCFPPTPHFEKNCLAMKNYGIYSRSNKDNYVEGLQWSHSLNFGPCKAPTIGVLLFPNKKFHIATCSGYNFLHQKIKDFVKYGGWEHERGGIAVIGAYHKRGSCNHLKNSADPLFHGFVPLFS